MRGRDAIQSGRKIGFPRRTNGFFLTPVKQPSLQPDILSGILSDESEKRHQLDRNIFVETYGCQMNEYDSGIVRSLFKDRGYSAVRSEEEAGVILLNTCAVREKAHERVYGRLQSLSYLKKRNPRLVIGILGCMAQNLGEDLFAMGLPVDLILGPDNYRNLPELIDRMRDEPGRSYQLTRISSTETYEELEPEVVSGPLAFVTIMRGCNNFCTFCVVPYTRGRERSREPGSIVREVQNLIDRRGVREITLLGQNVNSYRHESGGDFTDLVKRLLDETSIRRIRFTSPHPHDFPERLLRLMAETDRFCSSIHMPVQSGSTEVLRRMRRDYTAEEYTDLVSLIRDIVPDVELTTDVIVGFPGETEEDFQKTLDLVEKVGYEKAYMFHYSEREHTAAKKQYADDVPEEVKLERLTRLIALQTRISGERNRADHGREYDILLEGPSRRSDKEWMGRTESGKVVVMPVPAELQLDFLQAQGRLARIVVESSSQATLRGRFVSFVQ